MDFKLLGEKVRAETFTSGDFCLLSPGVIERLCLKDAGECLIATISPALLTSLAWEMADADSVDLPSAQRFRDLQIEHLLLALRAELESSCPSGRLYGESLTTALAAHILRRYWRVPRPIVDYHDGLPGGLLQRVTDFVKEHLDEDLALQQLADLVHMSPYHFARMFKKSTGLAPHRYLMAQRIERAKSLLSDHRLGLAEVAYSVGFPSQSHFTATFSRFVGTTPGAYRRLV
jgi:AraC family transcriptional regulator